MPTLNSNGEGRKVFYFHIFFVYFMLHKIDEVCYCGKGCAQNEWKLCTDFTFENELRKLKPKLIIICTICIDIKVVLYETVNYHVLEIDGPFDKHTDKRADRRLPIDSLPLYPVRP